MKEKLSQNKKLLAFLKTGRTVTSLQAWKLFGSSYLPARIADVKCMIKGTGKKIKGEFIKLHNGKRVKEFRLVNK